MASESNVQAAIVEVLAAVGFESLEIGASRRATTCPHCGKRFHPSGWQGNTPGTPDLFVGLAQAGAFPVCTWAGLELKKSPTAPVRPEQLELFQRGRVALVTSPRQAIEDMEEILLALDRWRAPESLLEALRRLRGQL